jgi:hypothetical protein
VESVVDRLERTRLRVVERGAGELLARVAEIVDPLRRPGQHAAVGERRRRDCDLRPRDHGAPAPGDGRARIARVDQMRRDRLLRAAGWRPGDRELLRAGLLEVADRDCVRTRRQRDRAGHFTGRVQSVVVHYDVAVDLQIAAFVGRGGEGIDSVLRHVQRAREPQPEVPRLVRHRQVHHGREP